MSASGERWRRIEEVCQAALDRDAAERPAFIAAACGGDSGLRREVEALLAKEAAAAGFLAAPLAAVAADAIGPAAASSLIGRRLGAYEIVGALGAGGMGEVYRARDTELGRDVAIKVLPREFLAHPERLARFEREARVLAALNHPNIAAIYGLEPFDGVRALVLELVEGQTLAERIGQRRIGDWRSALTIARQIADGLEAAHDKGIVHRDLKPANIKITPADVVKVLDFGLAKALDANAASATDASKSPTLTVGGTREGVLLGTAAYMSPEQARGQPVDKRADIWAFGCVLYELLAGRLAFSGKTVSDHIAAILDREPDWTALPATTPAAIQRLLRRCLEKDTKRRWHDIADVRIELEDAAGDSQFVELTSQSTAKPSWIGASIAGVLAAIGFAGWMASREAPTPEPTRFSISAPDGHSVAGGLSVSPDGRYIAFITATSQKRALQLRALESLTTRTLVESETVAGATFWSPDSRSIAFTTTEGLKKIDIGGGTAVALTAPNSVATAGTWSSTGVIVYAGHGNRLYRIAATGGQEAPLTELDPSRAEVRHDFPAFLPDGRRFIYTAMSSDPAHTALYLASLDSPAERTRLVDVASNAVYASGFLLYCRNGTLLAQRFDEKDGRVIGPAVQLVDGLEYNRQYGSAVMATSQNGVLAYGESIGSGESSTLTWVDRTGKVLGTVGEPGNNRYPRLSPDSRRLAFIRGDGDGAFDVWQIDLNRRVPSRFTFAADSDFWPIAWSSDSQYLVFASSRKSKSTWDLYRRPADGASEDELLYESPRFKHPSAVSPDGKILLFTEYGKRWDVWALPLEGSRRPYPVIETTFNESSAVFSPDGRWVAYVSDDSGPHQVYVEPFPPKGLRVRLSTTSGWSPVWLPNGREIVYTTDDQHFMAVDVSTADGTIHAAPPRELFAHRFIRGQFNSNFTVDPSGQRFLLAEPPPERFDAPIGIVLNWKSLVPKS